MAMSMAMEDRVLDLEAVKVVVMTGLDDCHQEIEKSGDLICAELITSLQQSIGSADLQLAQKVAADIKELAWERIHTGSWKSVPMIWRDVYSVILLASALCRLLDASVTEAVLRGVIQDLDMALLMGSPKYTETTEQIIQHIDKKLPPSTIPDEVMQRVLDDQDPYQLNPVSTKIERVLMPDLITFQQKYMEMATPVILTGLLDHWPAYGKTNKARSWANLGYLKRVAGRRTVPIEIGSHYMAENWTQKLVTLDSFIDDYILKYPSSGHSDKQQPDEPVEKKAKTNCNDEKTEMKTPTHKVGYLAQHPLFDQIPQLRRDIIAPDYCCIGTEEPNVNAWFGPKGTVSPLHFDPDHNLFAQVVGKKYIRIYDSKYSHLLYSNPVEMTKNTSLVDVENVDQKQFPLFAQAPYFECIISAGEVLYIPPKFWHFVRSLSLSFSVSFWWK